MGWLLPGEGEFYARGASEVYLQQVYRTWPQLAAILLVVSAASMVVGNLAALAQVSVRRLLAYSAIAHAGYILLELRSTPSITAKATLSTSS